GHLLAFVDSAGPLALTDRAGVTVLLLGAVAGGHAREVPARHDAGRAAALRAPGDVDLLAGREEVDSGLVAFGLEVPDLAEVALRREAGALGVPGPRLVHRLDALVVPAGLIGPVAVARRFLALHHRAGPRKLAGDGNQPVVPPYLGHANL